ncbi:hypothetical protein NQ315_010840 [Exocentrus adspersus]|uniref:Uncharacterized protein n=1 Tax=Exocentrus adspersus TaxID=1586481 RepID=A0AAV8V521_9CUCU|nr:hypothetical protein NQ315_010840 [Exocentrus adspersus]
MHNCSDSSDDDIPESVLNEAKMANMSLLPAKSQGRYEKEYAQFMNWCTEKSVKSLKEEIFLAYFFQLNKVCKPNTLWSRYSMLKSVTKMKNNIDISKFFKLTAYLKKQSLGFKPKKSKVFNKQEIAKFLHESSKGDTWARQPPGGADGVWLNLVSTINIYSSTQLLVGILAVQSNFWRLQKYRPVRYT